MLRKTTAAVRSPYLRQRVIMSFIIQFYTFKNEGTVEAQEKELVRNLMEGWLLQIMIIDLFSRSRSVSFSPGMMIALPTVINTDSPRRLVANSTEKPREVSKEKTA